MSGLSAGRVQSVATRLVVDRERERMRVPARVVLGPRGHLRRRRASTSSGCSPPSCTPSTAPGSPAAPTSAPTACSSPSAEGKVVHLDRARAEALVEGAAGHDVRRPLGRVQALPPLAVRPVPHHHAAAGGLPQARLQRVLDDVGGAAAVRERLHHLHAYRLHDPVGRRRRGGPGPGPRAVRRGVPPRRAPHLRLQGQERPGGARGDPARRRLLPHPGADRADRRPVPALRADLDAHRRVADEGRRRPVGLDPARRRRRLRRGRRLLRHRPRDHLPRLPQGLRRGHRRRRRRPGRRRDPAARRWPRATRSRPRRSARRATRPSRRPATPRPR